MTNGDALMMSAPTGVCVLACLPTSCAMPNHFYIVCAVGWAMRRIMVLR